MDTQIEKSGYKTMVKIQCQLVLPIRKDSWNNLPDYFQKMSDGYTKRFLPTIRVMTDDISNIEKLAFVVRKYYGFGQFNVLFYNVHCTNRFYNPDFVCFVQKGRKCDKQSVCNIWTRHKKGFQCKKNRKFRPNWSKRASIEILPDNYLKDKDYKFVWNRHFDRMHYFWFWQKGRRVRDNENWTG